mmetsp:Transcript_13160/g.23599  ORF Transcript_13160/g.23599 Transcript_13160/m.23599 type:complete len:799 (-) Transcript_13160:2667-5063(-)
MGAPLQEGLLRAARGPEHGAEAGLPVPLPSLPPLDGLLRLHVDGLQVVLQLQVDRPLGGRQGDLLQVLLGLDLVDLGDVLAHVAVHELLGDHVPAGVPRVGADLVEEPEPLGGGPLLVLLLLLGHAQVQAQEPGHASHILKVARRGSTGKAPAERGLQPGADDLAVPLLQVRELVHHHAGPGEELEWWAAQTAPVVPHFALPEPPGILLFFCLGGYPCGAFGLLGRGGIVLVIHITAVGLARLPLGLGLPFVPFGLGSGGLVGLVCLVRGLFAHRQPLRRVPTGRVQLHSGGHRLRAVPPRRGDRLPDRLGPLGLQGLHLPLQGLAGLPVDDVEVAAVLVRQLVAPRQGRQPLVVEVLPEDLDRRHHDVRVLHVLDRQPVEVRDRLQGHHLPALHRLAHELGHLVGPLPHEVPGAQDEGGPHRHVPLRHARGHGRGRPRGRVDQAQRDGGLAVADLVRDDAPPDQGRQLHAGLRPPPELGQHGLDHLLLHERRGRRLLAQHPRQGPQLLGPQGVLLEVRGLLGGGVVAVRRQPQGSEGFGVLQVLAQPPREVDVPLGGPQAGGEAREGGVGQGRDVEGDVDLGEPAVQPELHDEGLRPVLQRLLIGAGLLDVLAGLQLPARVHPDQVRGARGAPAAAAGVRRADRAADPVPQGSGDPEALREPRHVVEVGLAAQEVEALPAPLGPQPLVGVGQGHLAPHDGRRLGAGVGGQVDPQGGGRRSDVRAVGCDHVEADVLGHRVPPAAHVARDSAGLVRAVADAPARVQPGDLPPLLAKHEAPVAVCKDEVVLVRQAAAGWV